MEKLEVKNQVLIGDWSEVTDLSVSTITNDETDNTKLNGIIIKGYESNLSEINGNREKYEPTAFDNFIKRYFLDKELNMIVDLQHSQELENLAGRVIYMEVNSRGLYFVVYIPKSYVKYDIVKNLLEEHILQGFSKYGFATDYEYKYTKDGEFDYVLIKEMDICSVSLVSMPANGIKFEKVQEVKNKLNYKNNVVPEELEQVKNELNPVEKLFN